MDNSAASDVDSLVVIKMVTPKNVPLDCYTNRGTVELNTTSAVVGSSITGHAFPVLSPVTPVVGRVPE